MQITLLQRERTTVLALRGHVDRTGARELERKLAERHDAGDRWFVVDFSEVSTVSGPGLRALLGFGGRLERGGAMVLSSLNASVMHQLETSGLRSAFTIDSMMTEAIQRLRDAEQVSALTAELSRVLGARLPSGHPAQGEPKARGARTSKLTSALEQILDRAGD